MVPVWKEEGKKNSELITKLEIMEKKVYEKIEDTFNI